MKMKIVKTLLEFGREVTKVTSETINQWHIEAAQKRQNELAVQAMAVRFQDSAAIQRDLARIMQSMTPPSGLTCISDPRNLTFLPDYNTNYKFFAFFWQKSRTRMPISSSTLLSLAKRLNQRIQQMPAYLIQIGYSEEDIAADYPALYHGFSIADIQDSDDGVIITVRIK